jgi:hypothetical protein
MFSSQCHPVHPSSLMHRSSQISTQHSLEPISVGTFQFPSNSYTSASGFTRPTTASGSMSSIDPMPLLGMSHPLVERTQLPSTLHSPTCPSGVHADCTDSLGLRADSAQTVWTPYDFGSPHKNYTMRELNQAPGTNSHLQGGVLYHCAIVACYTLPTCAIYVTCGLIGKCVYFYSI